MSEEKKAFSVKFDGGKVFIEGDANKDGEPSLKLEIDLAEIADEVVDFFKKDKE